MRGWRRSTRARAREASHPAAPEPGAAANPFAPPVWPPPAVEALLVDPAPEPAPPAAEPPKTEPLNTGPPKTEPVVATDPAMASDPPAAATTPAAMPATATPEAHAELLRLFAVMTNMCDRVIEYIETDRAERRMMLETLATLGRTLTESAAALAARLVSANDAIDAHVIEPPEPRERVVGGSMPAGPEAVIDLRHTPAPSETAAPPVATVVAAPIGPAVPAPAPAPAPTSVMTTEIAVEVRGRFGDRWVDGFEICEVLETPEGPRYRLRRHRDGVVLPELFDATSIRHVETFEQLATTNGAHATQSPHNTRSALSTDATETNVNDGTGYAGNHVNGSATHWTRS